MQPQILLLKEGTDTSQGQPQLLANINACTSVADILRTTLGPMGMDKLIRSGDTINVSNDGATIIELLNIVHPAAKTLTEIAQSQDKEIGDGTTSVVLLAAEILKNAKEFIEEGVDPMTIIDGYRKASHVALKELEKISVKIEDIKVAEIDPSQTNMTELDKKKFLLQKCAETALTSKLIEGDKSFFSRMIVDAFANYTASKRDGTNFFSIKSVSGGSVKESFLLEGVAFKKTFSYAGFEQQPKKFSSPKVALLNVELELQTEHISGEVRVNPAQYKSIVDAEWKMLYDKLAQITEAGPQVVLSKLPVGDLAAQYFAEKGVFCAGRVGETDLLRVADLTGAKVQTSLRDLLRGNVLGTCKSFEEKRIGKEKYNLFTGGNERKLFTLILRGGAEQYIDEASRSLHDAIMVTQNAVRFSQIVSGGGAVEMELSRRLKDFSMGLKDKAGFIVAAFAKALEVIPRSLAGNAGMDSTDILNALRSKHHGGHQWFGVDIQNETVCDTFKNFIWEPMALKRNVIEAATEAACLVLSVDETIRVPKSEAAGPPRGGMAPQGMPPGMMGGMPGGMMG